jgi:LysM repeat protein
MYPRQFSFLKSLITACVLVVFSYVIVQANQMQVPDTSHQVPYRFVATQDTQSAMIKLNELDLIPVEVTDGVRKYIVKRGDTLLSIAAYYGTTIDKIKETNGITSTNLRV